MRHMRLDSTGWSLPGTLCWTLSLLVGCQEYTFDDNVPDYGGVNPPRVENPVQEDRIVQVTTPLVDILWVVDNSSSMGPYQDSLATNFPIFMNYFLGSGLDYHIGVVATEMERQNFNGKLVAASTGERFISLETEDPMARFAEMARLGEIIGSAERGREASYAALETHKNTENAGFLRDDRESGVHVMLISDEPDYSRPSKITKDEFVEYMNGMRADQETVTFNSICTPPNVPLYGGDDYVYITNRVGGILKDIREDDWLPVLEALGMQAAGLKREFFLSHLPVVDTIEVQLHDTDGNIIPFEKDAYDYSEIRNSITFETFVPDPLDTVVIRYTLLSALADHEDRE